MLLYSKFFEAIIKGLPPRFFDAAILALATLGIVLIYRTSFTTNFAQGSIAAFSGYIMYSFLSNIFDAKSKPESTQTWLFVAALLIAIVAAFLIGFAIDVLIIRRAKNITSSGKQMITMGMVLILTALTDIFFSPTVPRRIGRLLNGSVNFKVFGVALSVTKHNLVAIAIAILIISLVFIMLKTTKWGLSVRATASDELVTQMMGVNTRMITALSWAIAGALGAVAAGFVAQSKQLSPGFMTSIQVNAFLALILGGATTFIGPVVAALIIPVSLTFIAYFNNVYANMIMYILLLLAILILPNGIFGKKVVKKV